jgi:hypothetical protein
LLSWRSERAALPESASRGAVSRRGSKLAGCWSWRSERAVLPESAAVAQ